MATTYRSKRQPRTPTRAIAPRWSKAPLEQGDVDGKPNKPISRRNPSARFAIF